MGKRILALILMAVMMLTMGAQAVDTFAVKDTISLSFDGTTAICSARKDAAFTNTELNSTYTFYVIKNYGSTPILVDKGQKGRGTASCNLPATRYIIEANPLNVLKPRAFRFAACIMELIPSQTAFVMRW